MKRSDWVIPMVMFGPLMMLSFAPTTSTVGTVLSAMGALVLGIGGGMGFRVVHLQGKEIERLRTLVDQLRKPT